ncbi:unnamed protein product [Tetraodon nigroviridis]|uniref:Chromosome undetermined SCAF14764, whole genome shotgun sequence n=1 Tax=Tetraodon nigroviridis TaxID=99883 RepID=Q4S1Y2_TETNG|nr:unnamed protein product [Tetraodon nigroviridis]
MCNIVCNGHNDNPVCGSDSVTYDTPCHVREASCLKQQKIDIRHVGRCQGNTLASKGSASRKPGVSAAEPSICLCLQIKPGRTAGPSPSRTSTVRPRPAGGRGYLSAAHTCFSAFPAVFTPGDGEAFGDGLGPCPQNYEHFCEHGECEMRQNLPTCSGQKLHYVLIAAIIGAVQIAIIVAVVMCFTR